MGYTTEFNGHFNITPTLKPEHRTYLEAFSQSRRMKRDPSVLKDTPDPIREAAGLPLGEDAEYFIPGDALDNHGQSVTDDVISSNAPPGRQPELWCDWEPNDEGTRLQWSGSEKFYEYQHWLQYLLERFFTPWGYTLNGEVTWRGEEPGDNGLIRVEDNIMSATWLF